MGTQPYMKMTPPSAASFVPHSRLDELRPANAHGFKAFEVRAIMDEIYARGDRLMLWFLVSHMVLALGLAVYHRTWLVTIAVGGTAVVAFSLSAWFLPRTFFTRTLAGVAQQAFVGLHIYQLYGQSEQHFWYFTAFTMMIVYQDWLCMWPGALLIILQHSSFAYLHNVGIPVHFFPEPYVGFTKLFYHFGIAIVQVALCGYWAHLLRVQTLGDAWQKLQLNADQGLLKTQLAKLQSSEDALKASSEALARSSRQQRAILDNSPDAMWVKDLEGRYVAVNNAFARLSGRTMAEVEGKTVAYIVGTQDAVNVRAEEQQVISSKRALTVERELVVNGTVLIVESTVAPVLDLKGDVTGTAGIARDVSERRREEQERVRSDEQLQHAQKLESLGLLAGGIAHDFNNLLVAILANAELAQNELPPGSPAIQSFEQIEQAAQRAAELTRQMLAYAGKGKFDVQQLDMSAVVHDMADLLKTVVSKKATLRMELDDALPAVEADATQLRQVLMNLITNASDALGEGEGVITLRTLHVTLTAPTARLTMGQESLRPGRYIVVEVSDTGAGINPEHLERIFDPFFSTKFVGRGLGLAAVLGILRAHYGAITIESELGLGSTFRVFLPALEGVRAQAVPVAERIATDKGTNGRDGLILVVDDESTVRQLARRVVERAGYSVVAVADGLEAVEYAEVHASEISLVLLDMLMPRMNGEETFRELRRLSPGLPVLLTSGFSEEVAAQRMLSVENVDFIQKPYGAKQLLAAIDRLVGRSLRELDQPLTA